MFKKRYGSIEEKYTSFWRVVQWVKFKRIADRYKISELIIILWSFYFIGGPSMWEKWADFQMISLANSLSKRDILGLIYKHKVIYIGMYPNVLAVLLVICIDIAESSCEYLDISCF